MKRRTTTNEFPAPSTTESPDRRIPLRRALQRAEEVFKKEGRNKFISYLRDKELTGHARYVRTHESDECYEFSKDKLPLRHRDEYYKEREIYAYSLAFQKEGKIIKNAKVINGSISIFAFLDIIIKYEYTDSTIPIFGAGSHSSFNFDDENGNLQFETITLTSEFGIRESRYFRKITFERHECYDVSFAAHDIDRLLPYSTDTPTKQPQGAPQKFPQAAVNGLLDQRYPTTESLPAISEVMRTLGAYYSETSAEQPTEKTIRRKAKAWMDQRKRSTAYSGT